MKKGHVIALISIAAVILIVLGFILLGSKEVTVTFNINNGTQKITRNVKDGKVEKPEDPTREGYTFAGWYDGDELFDFNSKITKGIELTAKWEENSETGDDVIVSFDSDGGSDVEDTKVKKGSKVEEPTDPTREGYTFVEWQLNGKTYDFDTAVNSNITLKAVWEKKTSEDQLSVTFDSNGGSKVATKTVNKNATVSNPGTPSRDGYAFVEWQLDGKTYNFSSKVTSDITLKAVWEAKNQFTVTFDSNGGSNVSSKKVDEGSTVTKPGNPTRNGYTFVEWQLDGTTYNFSSKVTSDITLKAVWKEKAVTYSIKWTKVEESTADQYRLYIVDSNGNNVKGTVNVNYVGGGSQEFTVETSGRMFAYKTSTIESVTVVSTN